MLHRLCLSLLAATLLLAVGGLASLQAADKLAGLPDGANVVLSFSLKEIREQPDFEKNMQSLTDRITQAAGEGKNPLQQVKEATGLDIIKDVDTAAMSVYFPGPLQGMGASNQRPVFVAILNGRYDAANLMKNLESVVTSQGRTLQKSDYQGAAIHSLKRPNNEIFWSGAGQVLTVSNAQASIQKALDAIKAGASPSSDPKLKPYLADVKQTCPFFAAGYLPENPETTTGTAAAQPNQPGQPGARRGMMGGGQFAESIKGFALMYDGKGGETDFNAKVTCKDMDSAMQIKNQLEMVRGMVGMGALRQNQNLDPKMQEAMVKLNQFLQKIAVTQTHDKVAIALKLTKDETGDVKTLFDSLLTMRMNAGRQGGGPRGGGLGGRGPRGGAPEGPGAAPGKPATGAPAAGF